MLEKSFSYGMLMNLATNPLLPSQLIAVVTAFIEALYVDRFPQIPHGGAPCLPEKLWVFEEEPSSSSGGGDDEGSGGKQGKARASSSSSSASSSTGGSGVVRKSTTPILRDELRLNSEEAFPAFFLPRLSSVYGGSNPVMSHPDHFKFFLLRKFCSDSLQKFDATGRLTHSQGDINQFKMSGTKVFIM
jgi:hypothetical protein